jgi:pectinesterase inhibitor-like protein
MASRLTFLFVLSAVASTTLANTASSTLFGSSQPVAPPPPRLAVPPPAVAFLRARCATTPYLVTCYDSLMPYGCAFQTSHVKLARAATDVNHLRLSVLSKRVKELVAIGGAGVAADALRDCASTTSSAAGLARQSAAELAKLDNAGAKAGRGEVRWAISSAQTWLSAAMTNEATCADGLQPAGAPASREVVTGIASTKEHTSIALALVKGIPLPP